MKSKHLARRSLLVACLALLLLAGRNGIWGTPAPGGSWALAQTGSTTAGGADRLRITLDVLESNAVALRKAYETTKDCRSLRQAKEVAEALLVLAPAGSDSYRRGTAEWDRISSQMPRCSPTGATLAGRGGTGAAAAGAVVIEGGGGCINGLVAELLGQDSAFIQDYAERAGIVMDLTTIAGAERILLDVTPGGRGAGGELPYATVQASCDPNKPGVKGMSDAIFAYFLMTEQQRDNWLQDIPQSLRSLVPGAPFTNPTLDPWPVGPFGPSPTRPIFGPNVLTPLPGARSTPFPVRTLPPP